jgi:transglutaminase-like putative cysteine protease
VHGNQYRLDHGLTVSGGLVRTVETSDRFANHVVELRASGVTEWIEFDTWALVGCNGTTGVIEIPAASLGHHDLLAPTLLTQANDVVAAAAAELLAASSSRRDLAERACTWSHQALAYQYGVTGIHTDAATALTLGKGVCQDYAHLMLALCRVAGLPARYVSGHLLGEGGSHAWVEVLVHDPSTQDANRVTAVALDPTHDRQASQGYFTVAVGCDYSDVAPTSGTFQGTCPGVLSARKRLSKASPDEDLRRSAVVA